MNSPQAELALWSNNAADVGMAGVARDPASALWLERALDTIRMLAATGMQFDAQDVRLETGEPPTPAAMGAAFRAASRAHEIRPCGVRCSTRIQRKGGLVRLWEGAT